MKLNDGQTHKILFSNGKLFLDGVQIAGEGMTPAKDVLFEFQVLNPIQQVKKEELPPKDPSVLEVNVFDAVPVRGVGPGQL